MDLCHAPGGRQRLPDCSFVREACGLRMVVRWRDGKPSPVVRLSFGGRWMERTADADYRSLLAEGLLTMDVSRRMECGSEPMPASRRSAAAQPGIVLGSSAAASRNTSTTGRQSLDELTKRQRAARERAANERAERIAEALRNCEELQQQRDATARKSGARPRMCGPRRRIRKHA